MMTIVRGDTKKFYVLVVDQDGEVFNLTGYEAEFTARSSYSESVAAITRTGVVTALTGRIDFTLSPADTDVSAGVYKYDVQINAGGDPKYTVVKNQEWEITPGVTQT